MSQENQMSEEKKKEILAATDELLKQVTTFLETNPEAHDRLSAVDRLNTLCCGGGITPHDGCEFTPFLHN